MTNMEYFIPVYMQSNSKMRWRGWELEEEGNRERERKRERKRERGSDRER